MTAAISRRGRNARRRPVPIGIASGEWLHTLTSSEKDLVLNRVLELGGEWYREQLGWASTEATQGVYDWTRWDDYVARFKVRGLKPLAMIGGSPAWARVGGSESSPPTTNTEWATFITAVVTRYMADIHHWEIWNEPNSPLFWGVAPVDPVRYASLLHAAYDAIKAVDPTATVIAGGTSPALTDANSRSPADWYDQIFNEGADAWCDAIAHHPYSYPVLPSYNHALNAWRQMTLTTPSLTSVMAAHGTFKKIWITEVGAPTSGPGNQGTVANNYGQNTNPTADHVDQDLQGKILEEGIGLVRAEPWRFGPMFIYQSHDKGTDPANREHWFGIRTIADVAKEAWGDILAKIAATGGPLPKAPPVTPSPKARSLNGTNQTLITSAGALNGFPFDYGTMAAIFRWNGTTDWRELLTNNTGQQFIGKGSSGDFNCSFASTNSGSGVAMVANVWYLMVVTKPTGSAVPRYNIYRYDTGAWVSANGGAANGDGTTNITTFYIGSWQNSFEYWPGEIAAVGMFRHWTPNDAAVQAAGLQTKRANWLTAAALADKAAVWVLGQDSPFEQLVDATGGGANETTTFAVGDPVAGPTGWDDEVGAAQPRAYVKGVGPQVDSVAASAAVTMPTGTGAPAAGDLIVVLVAARPSGTAGTNDSITAAGYTAVPATPTRVEQGTNDLSVAMLAKIAAGGDADPTVAVGTAIAAAAGGWVAQILVLKGVDNGTALDATTTTGTNATVTATTFTGPAITPVTNRALVVSFVASGAANALSMTTAQGFVAHMSGANYDTTTGGDMAVGVAAKEQIVAGAVTPPTWSKTAVTTTGAWAGLTFAFRPAPAP